MSNNRFHFYAYEIDAPGGQTTIQSINGLYVSLPTVGTTIRQAPAGTTAGVNAVTINALVSVLPTGLNVKPTTYLTDSSASSLDSAGT